MRTLLSQGSAAALITRAYDYPDQELAALVPRIRELAKRVGAMHVVFNNNFEDQGQRNARTLMRLLAA